ncbi:MAG: serine/threonine-protein kinase [Planctomycetota bacterium]
MSPDRWQRIEQIFHELAALPETEQQGALAQACGADHELRAQVESLIASARDAQNSLDHPYLAEGTVARISTDDADRAHMDGTESRVGARIGPYRLEQLIAHGGMGEVYLAARADGHFDRRVAIKFIRGERHDHDALRRFEAERRALGALEHPNIARLLDSGTSDRGQPYFVMEYVDGEPIDRYCAERRLSVVARVRLLRTVCAAVEHAHRHLIVHRDLKPSNILVTRAGEPKLLDFGIAQLLAADASGAAAARDFHLTPDYASPEQLQGGCVTTASDVYSLGVILAELLNGKPPRRASERARVRGDLDAVVAKALAAVPTARYGSVEQLDQDLARALEHRPVAARPATLRYRAARFLRRNRLAVAATTLFLLSLVGGLFATLWQARIAGRAHQALCIAYDQAQQIRAFLQDMLASASPTEAGPDVRVRELLDRTSQRVEQEFADYPEVRAALHSTIGKSYLGLGLYDQAEAHFTHALTTLHALHRDGDQDTAAALSDLATVRYEQAAYQDAERLLRDALAIHDRRGTAASKEAAQILNNLGAVRRMQGEYDDAERLYRRALLLRRQLLGEEHLDVAETLNNLGSVLRMRGEWNLVEELLRESLAIRERLLPEDHPLVGQSLANLAVVLQSRGKLDQAEELYREALERTQDRLGDHHPGLVPAMNNFSNLLLARGNAEEAETMLLDCLAIATDRLPRDDWRGLETRALLARSELALGKTDAARATAELAWDALERASAFTEQGTATAARHLVIYYQEAHDADRVARLMTRLAPRSP